MSSLRSRMPRETAASGSCTAGRAAAATAAGVSCWRMDCCRPGVSAAQAPARSASSSPSSCCQACCCCGPAGAAGVRAVAARSSRRWRFEPLSSLGSPAILFLSRSSVLAAALRWPRLVPLQVDAQPERTTRNLGTLPSGNNFSLCSRRFIWSTGFEAVLRPVPVTTS